MWLPPPALILTLALRSCQSRLAENSRRLMEINVEYIAGQEGVSSNANRIVLVLP